MPNTDTTPGTDVDPTEANQKFLTFIWERGYWTRKDEDDDGRWTHVDIGGHRMMVKLAGEPGTLTVLGMRRAAPLC